MENKKGGFKCLLDGTVLCQTKNQQPTFISQLANYIEACETTMGISFENRIIFRADKVHGLAFATLAIETTPMLTNLLLEFCKGMFAKSDVDWRYAAFSFDNHRGYVRGIDNGFTRVAEFEIMRMLKKV